MNGSDPIVGSVYDGRYRILERIGQGGMANVYLAEDETLGRRVAIKVLHERYAADQQFVERFLREASAAARLNHPNIVQVYDRGQSGSTYYIAMEYVDGMTLKELIRKRGKLTETEILTYSRQALSALRFAHRNGIVHRDIKPHNMMVDTEGRLKIADFGIARAGADSGLTEAGSIVGTAQYLSPEQARGMNVAAPSDLYSCGVVMFEMATGRVPFDGDAPVTVALKHVNDPVPRPTSLVPELSPAIEAIILRAMQKEPSRRYGSADDMLQDLDAARGGEVSSETAAMTRVLAGQVIDSAAASTRVQPGLQPPPRRDAGRGYATASSYAAYPPDDDGDETRRRRWPWVLLLVLLLIAGGIAAWALTSGDGGSGTATVPNVVGRKQSAATRALRGAGFDVAVERDFSEQPVGTVVEQGPRGGTEADEGSTVTIVVSSGAEPTTVPDVVGLSRADAKREIEAADLQPKFKTEPSDEVEEGYVVRVAPTVGKQVPRQSIVTVTVSTGPETFDVPSVVGLSEGDARAELEQAGYLPENIHTQTADGPEPAGEVTAQDPASGTATPDDSITLTVASGRNEIPDTIGLGEEEARAALEEAGFVVGEVLEQEDPTMNPGDEPVVKSTTPPGTLVRKVGTEITIRLRVPPGP